MTTWPGLRRRHRSPTTRAASALSPVRAYAGLGESDDVANAPRWRSMSSRGSVDSTAKCSSSVTPPAAAGWTTRRSGRSSSCTTATPQQSRCSTPTCRAGSRSSSTRTGPRSPGEPCSTPCTAIWVDLPETVPPEARCLRRESGVLRRRDGLQRVCRHAEPDGRNRLHGTACRQLPGTRVPAAT